MSAKAIYEAKGKELLNKFLGDVAMKNRAAFVDEQVNWNQLVQDNPWLTSEVRTWTVWSQFYNINFSFSPTHKFCIWRPKNRKF